MLLDVSNIYPSDARAKLAFDVRSTARDVARVLPVVKVLILTNGQRLRYFSDESKSQGLSAEVVVHE